MNPKICIPVLLFFVMSFSFPQVKGNPTNPIASLRTSFLQTRTLLKSRLDAETAFLVLETLLTSAEFTMTAQLASLGVLSEVALSIVDILIHNIANGISNGTTSTLTAAEQCGQTATKQLRRALRQYSQAVQKCTAEEVDQLRVSFQSVERSISKATEVLANAEGGALACITSGQDPAGIIICIGQALPQTLGDVLEVLTKVGSSLVRAQVLTSALPARANICATAALAGTAAALAAAWDNLQACFATAPIQI